MRSVIIFYSYSGNSRKFAEKLREESGADIIEVKEAEKRTRRSAYLKGTRQARALQGVALADPVPDLSDYTDVTMVFPVWAGYPAPAFNSVLPSLPEGAQVKVYLSSAGGETSDATKGKLTKVLEADGLVVDHITDVRGAGGK